MPTFADLGLRPTWLQVDLTALDHNFRALRERTGPGIKICAIVKADAYGHGAATVARRLEKLGCDYFGVAMVEEGSELRAAGIGSPIVLLGAVWGEGAVRAAAADDIEISIHNRDILPAVSRAAADTGRPLRVHLKIDTGMGRLGIAAAEVPAWCREARGAGLELVGVYTTFSSADDAGSPRTGRQLERFVGAIESLERCGFRPPLRHAANSGAILNFPETLLTLVRPGLLLYGIEPTPEGQGPGGGFRPVASLRTRVAQVAAYPPGSRFGYSGTFEARRESRMAVLPVGYGDGVSRLLSNNGDVLIRGRRAPIVGRVSMDLLVADVSDLPRAEVGDLATLIGRDGGEEIGAWEVAERAGTIPWEVLCGVGCRVPRAATEGEKVVSIVSRLERR